MKTVNCEGVDYLAHEAEGNAARWIMPLALEYCRPEMTGLDIGYSKEEWKLKGSWGIEPSIDPAYDAMRLPNPVDGRFEYIFSSHCLEHVKENWYDVLDYWLSKIKVGGILFLYLPHASQNYWQPRNNRKHIHSFLGPEIDAYLKGLGHQVFVSGVDANHSFTVICEKKETRKAGWMQMDEETYNDIPALRDVLNGNIDEGHCPPDGGNVKCYMKAPLNVMAGPLNESRWFEQNTEDLANKIADMRMHTESVKPLIEYNVMDLVTETEALNLADVYGRHNISFGNKNNQGLYPISCIRRV